MWGPHLGSKLFDTQIVFMYMYQKVFLMVTMKTFERKKDRKKPTWHLMCQKASMYDSQAQFDTLLNLDNTEQSANGTRHVL